MRRKNTTAVMMKQYIGEALLLLMEKKAYDTITIEEITRKAGVNRSTYYRNFTAKDDILKFYFGQTIHSYIQKIPDKPLSLEQYLLAMYTHYYRYKDKLLVIYRANKAHLILETLNSTFSKIQSNPTLEKRYEIYYHTGGIYNTFVLWFQNNMEETPEVMAKISCMFLPGDFKPMLIKGN